MFPNQPRTKFASFGAHKCDPEEDNSQQLNQLEPPHFNKEKKSFNSYQPPIEEEEWNSGLNVPESIKSIFEHGNQDAASPRNNSQIS